MSPGTHFDMVQIGEEVYYEAVRGLITGEGTLIRAGKSIAFMEGRLFDEAGTLLATGSATAIVRKAPS